VGGAPMKDADIHPVITILKKEIKAFKVPVVGVYAESRDPFIVLVSCILSLRTRDKVTFEASERLFTLANTPKKLAALPVTAIEKAIYPVSFYRVKAGTLKKLGRDLLERYGGRVPDSLDELLTLKGVGRKTANLTLTLGHRKPGICVDIHVHRISNRLGYVKTAEPDETELALREKLPKKYWMIYNDLLVPYGQNLCAPVSPKCGSCKLTRYCKRVGVTTHR
jgi:endonuclease-3